MITTIIVLALVVGIPLLVGLYIWATYNRLVGLRNRVGEAWSDIQVQMKRRYDLIPNLVETVKGYAGHERGTLEAVIQARATAMANQGTPAQQGLSEGILTGALKSLFALSEAYPELKANENFMQMQRDLSEIEEHIQRSRRFYNGSVREMNDAIGMFPSNVVAGLFGFKAGSFFELDPNEREAASQAPKIDFKN